MFWWWSYIPHRGVPVLNIFLNLGRKHSLWAKLPLTQKWTITAKKEAPLQVALRLAILLQLCCSSHLQWFLFVFSFSFFNIQTFSGYFSAVSFSFFMRCYTGAGHTWALFIRSVIKSFVSFDSHLHRFEDAHVGWPFLSCPLKGDP